MVAGVMRGGEIVREDAGLGWAGLGWAGLVTRLTHISVSGVSTVSALIIKIFTLGGAPAANNPLIGR